MRYSLPNPFCNVIFCIAIFASLLIAFKSNGVDGMQAQSNMNPILANNAAPQIAGAKQVTATAVTTAAPTNTSVPTATPTSWPTTDPQATPRNIIIMIGDGMGAEQVNAASLYKYGETGAMAFEYAPYTAQMTTYSADDIVTDSGAAASAMATGHKVNNGVIAQAYPGNGADLETTLEHYRNRCKTTGLVTNTYINHATPASFGAHESFRDRYSEIAADYFTQTRPNILFGGRAEGITRQSATAAGYQVVTNRDEMQLLGTQKDPFDTLFVSGQFGNHYMEFEYDYAIGRTNFYDSRPHLSEMTAKALELLDNSPDGFFLLIEGGRIDHAGHLNLQKHNIFETLEFEKSFYKVINWMADRDDTLLLMTADHETGGLAIEQNKGRGLFPVVSWSTDQHTTQNVPVYAWGPNAHLVKDTIDNTDIYDISVAGSGADAPCRPISPTATPPETSPVAATAVITATPANTPIPTPTPTSWPTTDPQATPLNVIIMSGSGMGVEHVNAASLYKYGETGAMAFEYAPYSAQMTTDSADDPVPDSGAAASAMATGRKVNNGVISQAYPGDGADLETTLEHYRDRCKTTGLVTNSYINHAMPASFGAHESFRDRHSEIAADYFTQTRPNVLFGGTAEGITRQSATAAGYKVVINRDEMQLLSAPENPFNSLFVSGQFGDDSMKLEYDYAIGQTGFYDSHPHLSEMTVKALDLLGSSPDGFFLLIEGSGIDRAAHLHLDEHHIYEMLEFESAFQEVINWMAGRDDTLLLLTSGQEAGGLAIEQSKGRGNFPVVSWSTIYHTAQNVPVYAWGPNAHLVKDTIDNTDIYKISIAGSGVDIPCRPTSQPNGAPGPLISFEAELESDQTSATISWTFATTSQAEGFHILRSQTTSVDEAKQISDSMIPSPLAGTHDYQYIDETLSEGKKYYYWIEQEVVNQYPQVYGPVAVRFVRTPIIYLPLID